MEYFNNPGFIVAALAGFIIGLAMYLRAKNNDKDGDQ